MDSNVRALTNTLLGEISNALGFSKTGFVRPLPGRPLSGKPLTGFPPLA